MQLRKCEEMRGHGSNRRVGLFRYSLSSAKKKTAWIIHNHVKLCLQQETIPAILLINIISSIEVNYFDLPDVICVKYLKRVGLLRPG